MKLIGYWSRLTQRYLLGELLPDSFRLEDRLYREMIRSSNKSVIEKIRQIEDEQRDYREYMESWVHEIKAPITSISLLCENGRKPELSEKKEGAYRESFRTISMENQKIENECGYGTLSGSWQRSVQRLSDTGNKFAGCGM